MKVISVRQPWVWLIIHGGKDIENRDWPCRHRGALAIHAAKGMTKAEYLDCYEFVAGIDLAFAKDIPAQRDLTFGAIIGTVTMEDCVKDSPSPWFQGRYGFVLRDPKPIEPVFIKGALGLWEWEPAK